MISKKIKSYEYLSVTHDQMNAYSFKKLGINAFTTLNSQDVYNDANINRALGAAVHDDFFTTDNYRLLMTGINDAFAATVSPMNTVIFKTYTKLYEQLIKLGKSPTTESCKVQFFLNIPTIVYHIADITKEEEKRKWIAFNYTLRQFMKIDYSNERIKASEAMTKVVPVQGIQGNAMNTFNYGIRFQNDYVNNNTGIIQFASPFIPEQIYRNPNIFNEVNRAMKEDRSRFYRQLISLYGNSVAHYEGKVSMKFSVKKPNEYYILIPMVDWPNNEGVNIIRICKTYATAGVEMETRAILKTFYDKDGRLRLKKRYKKKYKMKYKKKYSYRSKKKKGYKKSYTKKYKKWKKKKFYPKYGKSSYK